MRPRVLLINPNTTEEITGRIHALAMEECGSVGEFTAITARFGARYISDRASAAIAAHAVLDAYAAAQEVGTAVEAVVVACFGDPGLEALAERVSIPVVGFAEAGIRAAAREPGKFIIATSGAPWRDMLSELVGRLGLSARFAGFVLLDEADRNPDAVAQLIEATARRLGAERAILGGTGLIPIISEVRRRLELAMIDPHRAAIREAVALAATSRREPRTSARGTFSGLSDPLARLLERPARGEIPAK
jgi:Asp/Glu/hydantoin racemase